MKNILVLIDNSVNSEHLAISAMNIALTIGANITLAHAVKNTNWDHQTENELANINERKGIAILEAKLNSIAKGKSVITCVMHIGSMVDLLAQQTVDGSIHLVVIGSHRSLEWEKVMFRTKIQDILENIGCPLLIIPKKIIVNQIKKTIFAVDLAVKYKKALRYVVAFSAPFGSQVVVNHISKVGFPNKPSEDDLSDSINLNLDQKYAPVNFHTIRADNVKTALLETIEAGDVDLLCLVHKNYDFLRGIFHVSMSKQLADNSLVPILILSE